jgi:hypothetical protein
MVQIPYKSCVVEVLLHWMDFPRFYFFHCSIRATGIDMGSEVVINAILQAGLREVQSVAFTGIKVYVFKR